MASSAWKGFKGAQLGHRKGGRREGARIWRTSGAAAERPNQAAEFAELAANLRTLTTVWRAHAQSARIRLLSLSLLQFEGQRLPIRANECSNLRGSRRRRRRRRRWSSQPATVLAAVRAAAAAARETATVARVKGRQLASQANWRQFRDARRD